MYEIHNTIRVNKDRVDLHIGEKTSNPDSAEIIWALPNQ